MGDLLTLHVAKISKIIKSCQTKDPIVFNKYLIYLSVLYNSKKISLRYEQ